MQLADAIKNILKYTAKIDSSNKQEQNKKDGVLRSGYKLFYTITLNILSLSLITWYSTANAANMSDKFMPQQQVILQLAAEQWAETHTALVVVEINATLDKAGLAQARQSILTKLSKIAVKADWHLTRFERSKTQSDLEQLTVQAEARLSADQLANLRSAAKLVSKPGENYRIANIDFSPSLADIEQAREKARENLYQQVKAEVGRLNKIYPETHYQPQLISFIENYQISPAYTRQQPNQFTVLAQRATVATPASDLRVSEKVKLEATVVLAVQDSDINSSPQIAKTTTNSKKTK
ncbi:MAG: hypothetical protein Tsb005_01960 [Gammaproteobacteria bacterium]